MLYKQFLQAWINGSRYREVRNARVRVLFSAALLFRDSGHNVRGDQQEQSRPKGPPTIAQEGQCKKQSGPGTALREKQHGLQLPRVTSADLRLRTAGVTQQANTVEELALNNAAYLELLNAPLPEEHFPPGPDSDAVTS
ncbi:hypothetical protein O1611_g4862 [Lasiodiplodia mahajangana]|uniref:Uncharacterized protein n=1 Tax=Lasiodiplodia mahajangana TaxID=1108764 RepID=A0ACC2JN48_9PEZI|nr:hypothetical protein O1611_g4862 [Lasiodiplodia mahajangana]